MRQEVGLPACALGEGEGSCAGDDDACAGGSTVHCVRDVGLAYGLAWTADVCVADTSPGHQCANQAEQCRRNLGGAVVASTGWKLIRNYDDNSLELYYLPEDLSEKKNVSKQNPELVARLNRKLGDWLRATGAPMPRPPKGN